MTPIEEEIQLLKTRVAELKLAVKKNMFDSVAMGELTAELRTLVGRLDELNKRKASP